jgi:pimeloyl-ACP methyl ester carboxylesterase
MSPLRCTIFLSSFAAGCSSAPSDGGGGEGALEPKGSAPRECVVLVHGLWRTTSSMSTLAERLEKEGYAVVNYGYAWRDGAIPDHGDELARRLPELVPASAPRVHFVTHSLGGVVVRQMVHDHAGEPPVDRIGRVVMLAPPNGGSELADLLRRNGIARWICGPSLSDLGTSSSDPPHKLGAVRFECGVLTGDQTIFGGLVFDGPSDGKVSLASARVEGLADFLVVPHGHSLLMYAEDVQHQVVAFLRDGRFEHPKS